MRIVAERARDRHLGWRRRCCGELAQRGDVQRGDAREVGEIDPADHVAIGAPVLRSHQLMLAIIILDRLGEADGGVARFQEGNVVAAALEAIGPAHRQHRQAHIGMRLRLADDRLHQRARRAVILAAVGALLRRLGGIGGGADSLAEDAHDIVDMLAADAVGVADDVVVEHRRDRPAACPGGLGQQSSPASQPAQTPPQSTPTSNQPGGPSLAGLVQQQQQQEEAGQGIGIAQTSSSPSLGAPNGIRQPSAGFPGQRPSGFQQPQPTGFPGGQQLPQGGFVPQPTGFQPQQTGFQPLQAQPTGFQPSNFQRRAPPPVPPIPSQFQNAQPTGMLGVQNANRSFLSPSPAPLTAQPTGFAGGLQPLVPQVTGFIDPRIQLMSNTFLPANPSAPYNPAGAPQLQQLPLGGMSLQQSFQQHNQEQRGTAAPRVPWALSKAEKKSYDQIFRAWDTRGEGFISGQTALEVFGQSGLDKNDLAKIWCVFI